MKACPQWRDPRVRALGVVVAVGGLAAWVDGESLRIFLYISESLRLDPSGG